MLGSAGTFGLAALELEDSNIVMLTADLCNFSGLDRFKEKYPQRFYNLGIAEQNMITVAGAMAKEGLVPFVTTYATFASSRACEQIRVNLGYMNQNVKVVGLASGLSVGILGPTHISLEDISNMRSIPNMTVVSPADCSEIIKCVKACAEWDGPVYLRLTGATNVPVIYNEDYSFVIGKAIKLCEGEELAIIATGTVVYQAKKAAELLQEYGIDTMVVNMHTIKPLDKEFLDSIQGIKTIVTVEEHGKIGGLGSAVAEFYAGREKKPRHIIIGLDDKFPHAGEYNYLLENCGLTAEHIVKKILQTREEE